MPVTPKHLEEALRMLIAQQQATGPLLIDIRSPRNTVDVIRDLLRADPSILRLLADRINICSGEEG